MPLVDTLDTLHALLRARNMTLVTAESCTGGLLAATIVRKAGATHVFERGFITYSNESKTEILGVPTEDIARFGAVSAQVAESMARGALAHARADLAISITGIAGPDAGNTASEKPVGTVFICIMTRNDPPMTLKCAFTGSRETIQNASVQRALRELISYVEALS